eukprot:maker-scaffold641_size121017-snap-gene-0.19 protein:Tk06984 transcript:maker-scaffold641_size121017-snap-gene-0.19-mRNA-1 annotation:"selenoprotein l"
MVFGLEPTQKATQALQGLLDSARSKSEEDLEDFISSPGPHLGGAIGVYATLLKAMNVETREELQAFWSKQGKNPTLTDAVEALWALEDDWDGFLKNVDKTTMGSVEDTDPLVDVGHPAPDQVSLVNARDQNLASLKDLVLSFDAQTTERVHFVLLHRLRALKIAVVVVSFGVQTGADNWLKETGCNLPMFLDPDRKLYRAFGLHRSLAKVFNHDFLSYYGGQLAAGRELPKTLHGIEDDPLQMGGDFAITRPNFTMSLVHRSKNPSDRPSLDRLHETGVPARDQLLKALLENGARQEVSNGNVEISCKVALLRRALCDPPWEGLSSRKFIDAARGLNGIQFQSGTLFTTIKKQDLQPPKEADPVSGMERIAAERIKSLLENECPLELKIIRDDLNAFGIPMGLGRIR